MHIEDILKKQRKIYIDFFLKEMKKSNGISEVLINLNNKNKIDLYAYKRYDCIEKAEDGIDYIEFNNDQLISHKPTEFKYKQLNILIEPFFWNECEIHFDGELNDFSLIINWGKKWIRFEGIDDESEERQIFNVIHQVNPPEKVNEHTMLMIDFGTVEIKAVIELFNAIEKMDVKHIKLSSVSAIKTSEA